MLGILFGAFAATRLWQRERAKQASLRAPRRNEAALNAALAEAVKAVELASAKEKQTPSEATETELMRAVHAYAVAEDEAGTTMEDLKHRPYVRRVPVQLRQAGRDLRDSGNVLRFFRGLRHALLPMLDRPEPSTAT